jgi:hypothetical protein
VKRLERHICSTVAGLFPNSCGMQRAAPQTYPLLNSLDERWWALILSAPSHIFDTSRAGYGEGASNVVSCWHCSMVGRFDDPLHNLSVGVIAAFSGYRFRYESVNL